MMVTLPFQSANENADPLIRVVVCFPLYSEPDGTHVTFWASAADARAAARRARAMPSGKGSIQRERS